ncbi:MAG: cysteine desulfurase family protein [Candidatus Norongarragalinales archaeon]
MKVYLDNAATTRVDERVLEAMRPFFVEHYGNASSLHSLGVEAKQALEESRETIAKALGATAEEIVFTASGSEADNLAVIGAAMANRSKEKNRVVVSSIEHPAVFNAAEFLKREGFEVVFLPVDREAFVKMDALRDALTPSTIIVSVMHANNEVGTIEPIVEIAKLCKEKEVLFHTDAVQSFTKEKIDLKTLLADFVSLSAHKIHGPKGVGALFVRRGVRLQPLVYGGPHEHNLRAGTENVAGIVGFAEAVRLAQREAPQSIMRMRGLRDALIKRVLEVKDAFLNGATGEKRLCNNAHFRFDGVEGEALLLRLDALGVETSTGSACSSASLKPSRVLLAMGLSHVQAHGSLRLTLSRFTTAEEIDFAGECIERAVKELREFSALRT